MAFATLHIAYELGPSSRTTVALWATGSHEARRSQAKLAGVALSVGQDELSPVRQAAPLVSWTAPATGCPRNHESCPRLPDMYNGPSCMIRTQCGTVNFGLLLPFAHGSQKPEEAVRMKVPASQG